MRRQDSITQQDFTNLLAAGAFLREGSQVHLMVGPFRPLPSDKKQDISVCCPLFFECERLSFSGFEKVLTMATSEFLHFLSRQDVGGGGTLSSPSESQIPGVKGPSPAGAEALVWEEPRREDFEAAFSRIQNLISQGQIDKAVPVAIARARRSVTWARRCRWLSAVLQAPPSLTPYGWWNGDEGLIGATPEVLFDLDGRVIRTVALAGTLARVDGSADDLLRSRKDQHEHRCVVEDLRSQLSLIGTPRIGATEVLSLPTLHHLRTAIEVEASEDVDVSRLIALLHPTAALGVYPRLFGWRWLGELPGQEERRRFGAPVVFRLSPERVVALVAIRNLQWRGDDLILASGCGVVAESDIDTEWRELRRKREAVLAIMEAGA